MKRVIGQQVYEEKVLASRFVAFACEINSVEELPSIIEKFKKDYPKADHYPYAYIIDVASKSSDDGEPSGTAGRQFLELLKKEDLNHVFIGIARYFGGSKLGVGRLTRTFVETAKGALDSIKKGTVVKYQQFEIEAGYSSYEKLKKILSPKGFIFKNEVYEENVKAIILVEDIFNFNPKDYNIDSLSIKQLNDVELVKEL